MISPFRKAAVAVLSAGFLLTACNKDALTSLADVSFSKSYSEVIDLTINPALTQEQPLGASIPIPQEFTRFKFATGIDQIAAENNTSADKLVSVKVDSMYLKAVSPSGQTLNFIDTLRIYATSDSLPSVLVAKKVPMPKNGSKIVYMDMEGVNLKPYFQKDSIGFALQATINAIPPAGTKLEFANVFKIVANPLR